ncbi:hypothetical protein AUP68_08653 [Ilyonectria robusta]
MDLELMFPSSDAEYKGRLETAVLQNVLSASAATATGLQWLTHCRASHPACRESHLSPKSWHPTRMLDIGSQDSTSWRLCVTAEGAVPSSARYLTLSYRWGSNPIRLLSSNVEAFRRGWPIAELPVLFRDVFEVARQFSIRYVWIDALCIIQDQQDDWAREASTMHLVYSNSVCTIAASGSTSPDDSLFHEGDPAFIRPGMVQSTLCSDEPQSFYILDYNYWDRQIHEGPLHNRGWVFQERHLSPRTLFFGRHQILWECWTEHKCEAFPKGVPFHHSDKTLNLPKVELEAPSPQNNVKNVRSMSLWGRLITEYSRCELTHPSDKLHAIAGVAKWFEKVTGDEYVAGLWKSRFELMLDWRIHEPKPRLTQDYRAPSWSWASVDGPVKLWGLSAKAECLVELVRTTVETSTPDKMSTVLRASAVLRARVIPAICEFVDLPFVTFQTSAGEFRVQIFLDTSDVQVIQGRKISYMPLKLDYNYFQDETTTRRIVCIMLEQLGTWSNRLPQYRRLGHFVLHEQDSVDLDSLCVEPEMGEAEIV